MIVDPPPTAWYRPSEAPLALQLRVRDAATARALQAYLATSTTTEVRPTVEVRL